MSEKISASVGARGQNRHGDVVIIQRLLLQNNINPGPVDGLCGPLTVSAILKFQSGFLSHPDGRVDPKGITLQKLNNQSSQAPGSTRPPASSLPATPSPTQSLTETVAKPSPDSINQGLEAVSNSFMMQKLGRPRESYSTNCQPITNPVLKNQIVTESVGPFRVTGLRPAVKSLQAVMEQVKMEQPAVYTALGTAGMLCCRFVRGSTTSISNHSWGTAVDLKLNGILDHYGDNTVQIGLTLIAPIFNQHGWYWGVAFRKEDAMHFEASKSLVLQWAAQLK